MLDKLKNILDNSTKAIKSKLDIAMNYGYDNLICDSRRMIQITESVTKLAPTDINIVLQGELGTGKEHISKIIHYHSRRYKKDLVIFDCSVLPEELVNNEFFDFDNFENALLKANGGTLLIKNVDKMSLSTQNKFESLLTGKLSSECINNCNNRIDIRILSTSESDLDKLSGEGMFSPLLLQLLGEIKINIPPLRKRKNDIELLLEYFIVRECVSSGKPIMHFTADVLDILLNHDWKENIHELKNTVRRAVKLSNDNLIDKNSIILIKNEVEHDVANPNEDSSDNDQSRMLLDEGQKKLIIKTLNKNNWNFTQTARELGIGRTTLWRKVKKYELKDEVPI
jgi:DNA-binding NtrC family response regulator